MMTWDKRAAFAQEALLVADRISNGAVFPIWIDDSHFWYERRGDGGAEYAVVDAASGERLTTLPRVALATALAQHLDAPVDAEALIVRDPVFDLAAGIVHFSAYGDS